jgi:hypothetical protein
MAAAQKSKRSKAMADTPDRCVEHELIPSTSRLSRLPAKVPASPVLSASPPTATAIPAHQNTTTTNTGHDVPFSVNTSPVHTSAASFTPPLTQHDLKHPIRRPRTSANIFQSSTDLAAHYGIPQRLPPAPSTTYQPPSSPKQPTPLVDFQTLSQNYLNMLSNKPTVAPAAPMDAMATDVSAAELHAPVVPPDTETLHEIAAMLASSPEFRDLNSFDAFMTSPMPGLEQDFGVSPEETPYQDFLHTPLFDDDDALITSPMMGDMPLFPEFIDTDHNIEPTLPKAPHQYGIEAPYTISPFSPALESFDHFAAPSSSTPKTTPAPVSSAPTTRRTSKAIGIRKGITPDSLLSETAPTQARKYVAPSATSKKEVPATFARKRARSTAFGDEEDQLGDDLPLNPTERDLIEQKRRQNTVAARRSRKRKLEQYQNMEKARDEERQLKETWKERANVLLATLREHGVNYPDFPEDDQRYGHV